MESAVPGGPADPHGPQPLTQADRSRLRPDPVGDEMGPGPEIQEQPAEKEGLPGGKMVFPETGRLGKLAAEPGGIMQPEVADDLRVEAFHAGGAVIFRQHPADGITQLGDIGRGGFQFNNQRLTAGEDV